jgi:hypothetical protein
MGGRGDIGNFWMGREEKPLTPAEIIAGSERLTKGWTQMSFSVSFVGKPDALKRALASESERLTGQSKEEFDAVKPAIETILDQNMNIGGDPSVFRVDANGHANFKDGVKQYGNCVVNVQRVGILVE